MSSGDVWNAAGGISASFMRPLKTTSDSVVVAATVSLCCLLTGNHLVYFGFSESAGWNRDDLSPKKASAEALSC